MRKLLATAAIIGAAILGGATAGIAHADGPVTYDTGWGTPPTNPTPTPTPTPTTPPVGKFDTGWG